MREFLWVFLVEGCVVVYASFLVVLTVAIVGTVGGLALALAIIAGEQSSAWLGLGLVLGECCVAWDLRWRIVWIVEAVADATLVVSDACNRIRTALAFWGSAADGGSGARQQPLPVTGRDLKGESRAASTRNPIAD